MPWLDVSAAVLSLAALIVGVVTRRGRARPAVVVGSAAVLVLAVALFFEGGRVQVLAIAVLAAAGAGVVLWARSRRGSRLAVASVAVLGLGLTGTAGASWALPPMSAAAPTGPDPVGVTSEIWTDTARDARGGVGGPGERSLPVTIWYPAAHAGPPSAYLPEEDAAAAVLPPALAQMYGAPALVFDSLRVARSDAGWRVQPAAGAAPVVIASPGFASTRWFFTSWAQELASNGIVVVALDHPYDAIATGLADGSIAYDQVVATGDDDVDQDAADRAAGVRAADIRAVIDHLRTAAGDTPELAGADTTTIIAAGHSAGGASAIEAGRLDERISGVIDLDGMPRSPAGTRLSVPLLAVVAGDAEPNPAYAQALDDLLADGNGARLTFDGVAHLGMVDSGRLVGPLPGLVGVDGANGPRRAARAAIELVTAVEEQRPLDLSTLGELGALG